MHQPTLFPDPKTKFQEFLSNLAHWLDQLHCVTAVAFLDSPTTANVALWLEDEDEEDCGEQEGNFYVGNFAIPGLRVEWLGEHTLKIAGKDEITELVCVNGIVFSAFGRHIAGWVIGYE
jgi:hypothetical protein